MSNTPNHSDLTPPNADFWRRKLNAFLHDNPDKALDVGEHELKRFLLSRIDLFQSFEVFDKNADFYSAAADRLPFPHHGKMRASFDGFHHPFHHPLGGKNETPLLIRTSAPINKELAFGTSADSRPYLDQSDPRSDFIVRWRFWRQWAVETNPAFAYLPADTRVPDHTIWNHMSLTSAFQGCSEKTTSDSNSIQASLLLFSIGPVQPVIAAARNFRDLWSGSFLLSYLIAEGMGVICKHLGPDHILFPNIWGVPLIDLMLKEVYESAKVRKDMDKTLWDQLWVNNSRNRQWYLQPNLPNRFLALVPASRATEIATAVKTHIEATLQDIGHAVISHLDPKLGTGATKNQVSVELWFPERIAPQLKGSIECQWQTFNIPTSFEEIIRVAEEFLPRESNGTDSAALASVKRLREMWNSLPRGHHTSYGLLTPTSAWPVLFALSSWLHDGAKRTRAFPPFPQDPKNEQESDSEEKKVGRKFSKDSLTGKDVVVLQAPSSDKDCRAVSKKLSGGINSLLLKPSETMGALTLVKRFWHLSYLYRFGFDPGDDFHMPDLHQMAQGLAYEEEQSDEGSEDTEKGSYIAVIALDGDEMGKWVSGVKTPPVRTQLANKALEYYEQIANESDDASSKAIQAFLSLPRPLNPSFHLQFSEALSNFGLYTVRRIVEAHRGRLVYSGGDDVLAVVPATESIRCAETMRGAFRGDPAVLNKVKGIFKEQNHLPDIPLFDCEQEGTVRLHPELREQGARLKQESPNADFLLPGPNATCSIGVAIAHFKSPLQDVVRAAQAAEMRAKQVPLNRDSLAVTIMKRSGETHEWGSSWKDGGLPLLGAILDELITTKRLSSKFPHRVCELLAPYLTHDQSQQSDRFDAVAIVWAEFSHALKQQCSPQTSATAQALISEFEEMTLSFLKQTQGTSSDTNRPISAMIGLCNTAAFIKRIS